MERHYDSTKNSSNAHTGGLMNFLGMIRNQLSIIHDNFMATAKKATAKKAPAKKVSVKTEPRLATSVAEFKAMTKKERMAARHGFAK